MKHMYRVTRPAWAAMERYETVMIASAGLALGLFVAGRDLLLRWLGPVINGSVMQFIVLVVDLSVSTVGCILLLKWYKRQRVGCYPSTFFYCFYLPEASNPIGKTQVVGYCHIKPNMHDGEIVAHGASFFWANSQPDTRSRVGFKSTRVYATQDEEEATCHIMFNIDSEDANKRLYHHGILQFRLASTTDNGTDVYAGYLRSYNKETELADIEVQSKGYAEFWSRKEFDEKVAFAELRERGHEFVARLDAMLATEPPPSLWKDGLQMYYNKTNVWGHRIPTPQSVMLNAELAPYIDRLLSVVLRLIGLTDTAIERFKALALEKARVNADDTRVAYERELKRGLVGLKVPYKEGEALAQRADLIYREIGEYLIGESLLDIGCGNGLISNLAKEQFKVVQLLDVVNYLQPALIKLPFELYTDGQPLPVRQQFDTVLLITVLHHSNEPLELLKLAWAATAKRLIIIESVVGIHQLQSSVRYDLVSLGDDKQIAYAAFVDWFYNRVLHEDIPVPYNFTTPEKWNAIFVNNSMQVRNVVHLGQDIEIGPEYHVLFVLDK